MNKAIFLDRDGTINKDFNFVHKLSEWEWIDGAIDAIRTFQNLGYLVIIVTNQSGICRGRYTDGDFELLTSQVNEMLSDVGLQEVITYHCPHHPDFTGDCDCKKPKTGMFDLAIKRYNIDPSLSYMVGDKMRDLLPALKLGINANLVLTGHGISEIDEISDENISIFKNLSKFAERLEKDNQPIRLNLEVTYNYLESLLDIKQNSIRSITNDQKSNRIEITTDDSRLGYKIGELHFNPSVVIDTVNQNHILRDLKNKHENTIKKS